VTGTATGTGTGTIRSPSGAVTRLRQNVVASGVADIVSIYGRSTDLVLVGDWNGDGTDTLGVRRLP
jgi:hypothetical protein